MASIINSLLRPAGVRLVRIESFYDLISELEQAKLDKQELEQARLDRKALQASLEFEKRQHAATAAQLPTLLDRLISPIAPALKPSDFGSLQNYYDSIPESDREALSRHAMNRCIGDPIYFQLLSFPFAASKFKRHPLYRQMVAAATFGHGRVEQAADILNSLSLEQPSPFNDLCYARAVLACGGDVAAAELLEHSIRKHGNDLFLVMEYATTLYRLGKIDEANRVVQPVLSSFQEEKTAIEPLQREIENAIDNRLMEKSTSRDIYTDEFVIDTWWFYFRSYMTSTEHRDGNVALEAGIQRVASDLLRGPLGDATTFIDFGAFCGYTIATLATHFPRTWFVGIDRPEIAKSLNDQAFGRKNVEFLDGDILDLLASRESFGARPVLFHSRTAVFCYPEYLRQLYRKCAEKGIRDIVMQEGSTFFSRWYLRFFEPGKYPAISFAGRGSTFLHDYMTLLREAGFEIQSSKDIRPKLLLDDRSGFGADHRIVHASLRR